MLRLLELGSTGTTINVIALQSFVRRSRKERPGEMSTSAVINIIVDQPQLSYNVRGL